MKLVKKSFIVLVCVLSLIGVGFGQHGKTDPPAQYTKPVKAKTPKKKKKRQLVYNPALAEILKLKQEFRAEALLQEKRHKDEMEALKENMSISNGIKKDLASFWAAFSNFRLGAESNFHYLSSVSGINYFLLLGIVIVFGITLLVLLIYAIRRWVAPPVATRWRTWRARGRRRTDRYALTS